MAFSLAAGHVSHNLSQELIRTGYTATGKPVRVMISIDPGDTLILQYTFPT